MGISQAEAFVFHSEELEGVVQNPRVLEAQRLVTTFLFNPATVESAVSLTRTPSSYWRSSRSWTSDKLGEVPLLEDRPLSVLSL